MSPAVSSRPAPSHNPATKARAEGPTQGRAYANQTFYSTATPALLWARTESLPPHLRLWVARACTPLGRVLSPG